MYKSSFINPDKIVFQHSTVRYDNVSFTLLIPLFFLPFHPFEQERQKE